MAATETIVLAAASSGIGIPYFTCFIVLLTIFNIYTLYKLYIEKQDSHQVIDVESIRRDRVADELKISAYTSTTTLGLQASSKNIVSACEAQQTNFLSIIGKLQETIAKIQTSAQDVEVNQQSHDKHLQDLTGLLIDIKTYSTNFSQLATQLLGHLSKTQTTLANKEKELGEIVNKFKTLENQSRNDALKLRKLTDEIPKIDELTKRITHLEQDKKTLTKTLENLLERLEQQSKNDPDRRLTIF